MDHPRGDGQFDEEGVFRMSRELILLREQRSNLESRESELKKILMDVLEDHGEPSGPEGQHSTIRFPIPIRGMVGIVRQTRSSTSVDSVRAEALARSRGIYDRFFKPVMVLDQDAVMVALMEGRITDDEFAEVFPRKTTYAFVVEKEK